VRAQRRGEAVEVEAEPRALADTSLTTAAAQIAAATRVAAAVEAAAAAEEIESSAHLLTPPAPVAPKPVYRPLPELVTMPSRPLPQNSPPIPADTLRYASRRWHAEAWERERERELRAIENHPDTATRRRTSA